jgi:hypothetical protein
MQFVSIEEIQRQLDKLLDLATKEAISTETYKLKAEALELELAKRQQEQRDTADRVKNWYEIIGITLERLCNASENFRSGDFGIRREILLAIGCNPIITDKRISIEPNPWVIPIKDNLQDLKSELAKVETDGSIKKNKSSLDREQSLVKTLPWPGKDRSHSATPKLHLSKQVLKSRFPCELPPAVLTLNN